MKKIITIAILSALSASSMAQNAITISTGGPKGTYSSFFKSMQAVCGDKVQLIEKASTGSDANLESLINRQADAALVQSDTLQFTALNDPRASESQIRVLLPMYPEEVHVVALKDLSKTTGGISFMGKNLGGSKQELNSLADLSGLNVGAWGGSYTTARAIAYLGSVRYEVTQFDDDKAAKAALDKGAIAAIIAVGGQPLGFVKDLNANYKLLKIDSGLADKVKAYAKTRVSYRNVNASGMETVSARSLLVVKNYASVERKTLLSSLKKCLQDNEVELKEGNGHHPKWGDVDFAAPVSWAMYETNAGSIVSKEKVVKK